MNVTKLKVWIEACEMKSVTYVLRFTAAMNQSVQQRAVNVLRKILRIQTADGYVIKIKQKNQNAT